MIANVNYVLSCDCCQTFTQYRRAISEDWKLRSTVNYLNLILPEEKKLLQKVFPCFKNQTLPCRHHVCFTECFIQGLFLFLKSDYDVYSHQPQYRKTGYSWLCKRTQCGL